jgi:hypothetical protein
MNTKRTTITTERGVARKENRYFHEVSDETSSSDEDGSAMMTTGCKLFVYIMLSSVLSVHIKTGVPENDHGHMSKIIKHVSSVKQLQDFVLTVIIHEHFYI